MTSDPSTASAEFSFADGTLSGWKTAEPPPLIEATPESPDGGTLTFADTGRADEPGVDVAFRWSKLYERDIEYEPFFDWIGRRSNPERTDFREILDSLPLNWGPESLPPPLRRYFLRRFNRG